MVKAKFIQRYPNIDPPRNPPTIKQRWHLKVKGAANLFDKEWDAYFKSREKLLKMQSVNEFIGKVLKRQHCCCPGCRQVLQVGED